MRQIAGVRCRLLQRGFSRALQRAATLYALEHSIERRFARQILPAVSQPRHDLRGRQAGKFGFARHRRDLLALGPGQFEMDRKSNSREEIVVKINRSTLAGAESRAFASPC